MTIEYGLSSVGPKHLFQPLSEEQTRVLLTLVMAELKKAPLKEDEPLPFLSQVVQKRIDVAKLPISFNPYALLAISVFTDRPGAAVLFLIDALNKFEGKEVSLRMINMQLYPWGFYTEEAMIEKIDNEIKTKKLRWSELY